MKTERKLHGMILAMISWIWWQKHRPQKEKIDKWDNIKLINPHSEGYSQQNENVTHRLEENICKPCTW